MTAWLLMLAACAGPRGAPDVKMHDSGRIDDSGPTSDSASPDTGPADDTGSDPHPLVRFGVCDALDVRILDLASLEAAEGALDELPDLGLTVARPHRPGGHVFAMNLVLPASAAEPDFTLPDAVVTAIGERGVAVIGTLLPETDAGDGALPPRTSIEPDETERWRAFVTALVERYDGDGLDDMPGLVVPVAAWEVANEPRCEEDSCRGDFVELTRITQAAARAADSDVPVIPGGPLPLLLAADTLNADAAQLVVALDDAGVSEAANLHMLVGASAPTLGEHAEALRGLVEDPLPLWISEMGTRSPDGRVQVAETAAGEAEWLLAQWQEARVAGVHTVLWCQASRAFSAEPEIYEAAQGFIRGQ